MSMIYSTCTGMAIKKKPKYVLSEKSGLRGPVKTAAVSIRAVSENFLGRSRSDMVLQKIFGNSLIRYATVLDKQLGDEMLEVNDRLRKTQQIKNFLLISSYRGLRHKANMPVRGQRTHTNAKTRRKRKID